MNIATIILATVLGINAHYAKVVTRAEMGLSPVKCEAIVETFPERHETVAFKHCVEIKDQ